MRFLDDLLARARRTGAPITVTFIVIMTIVALVCFFSGVQGLRLLEALTFRSDWLLRPWTILTYPFAYTGLQGSFGLIGYLFLMFWLFMVGGSVERDLGGKGYGAFTAAMTVLGGLSFWIAVLVLGGGRSSIPLLWGPALPLAAIVVAWATRNPEATVLFMMVIPIKAKWIGYLTAGLTFFGYGAISPILGAFSLIPLVASYAFASNRIAKVPYGRTAFVKKAPTTGRGRVVSEKYFDEVRRREQAREERERLRKLFEGSIDDDKGAS